MPMRSLFYTASILIFFLPLSSGFSQASLGVFGGAGVIPFSGFRAGIAIELPIQEHLALQSEFAFNYRPNQEVVRKVASIFNSGQGHISYLDLPLILKLKLDLEPVHLYGLGGLGIGYGMYVQVDYWIDDQFFREWHNVEELDIRHWDVGIFIGGGGEWEIGRDRRLFMELRHYLGVVDIDRNPNTEIYNQHTFLMIGMYFPLYKTALD